MALGFGSKSDKAEKPVDSDIENKAGNGIYNPDQSNYTIGGRPMNRIDGPMNRRTSINGDDSSLELSVGKQIEMEAENAIQYRTCSWPKVCFFTLRLWRG